MKPYIKRISIIVAVLFFTAAGSIYFLYDDVLNKMAQMLIREDKIEPSDAIVVLSGGNRKGERIETGIELMKAGYGKYLVFWGGTLYWKVTYADLIIRQLQEAGITDESVIWSDEELEENSTYGEALVNIRQMKQNGINSFILVTSPYHTSRAASVYEKLIREKGMKMYVQPSKDSSVKFSEWWRDRHSSKVVYYEWNKRIFYWLNYRNR